MRPWSHPVPSFAPGARSSRVRLEEYPYSDGRVLMEADPHANSIVAMHNQLQWHFEGREDVYVAGSLAVYYRRADRSALVEPAVFVVLAWRSGIGARTGSGMKEGWCRALRWRWLRPRRAGETRRTSGRRTSGWACGSTGGSTPAGSRIPEGLIGWRLEGGRYERVPASGQAGWFRSEVLDLELRAERWLLRFRDPRLGRDLMTHVEASRALQEWKRERGRAKRERGEAERMAEAEAAAQRTAEGEGIRQCGSETRRINGFANWR